MITIKRDGSPWAQVIINMTERSMNVLTFELAEELDKAFSTVLADETIHGLILGSGKSTFLVGADLAQMASFAGAGTTPEQVLARVDRYSQVFRRIERCGKPVVAVASGTALGAGFELMLCCHYRIAAREEAARFGLPEVTLGLMPGLGGSQRIPRLLGIAQALPLLLRGTTLSAQATHELGLLDELVPAGCLIEAAVRVLNEGRVKATAAWDEKGYRLPKGDAYAPANLNAMIAANASTHAESKGHYPAPTAILQAVYEGTRLPIDRALRLEQQLFVSLVQGSVAQNMIRTRFFARQAADKLTRRPAEVEPAKLQTVGVLGSGFMGAGIAHAIAAAGLDVVLVDRELEIAAQAAVEIGKWLAGEVAKGRRTPESRDGVLRRIRPSADYSTFANCELVIEAVPEDISLKRRLIQALEVHLAEDAVVASNTSALPIGELAQGSQRPQNIVGLHFFSPVSHMALVEVVVGKPTSRRTLATAMDFVARIRKTPIVVRDGYGFYTTRCVEAYIREGVRLLADGVNSALIENAGTMLGMPVGPLALADEVGIDVLHHIAHFFRERERGAWAEDKHGPGNIIIDALYGAQRLGRKSGHGFYLYPKEQRKRLDVTTVRKANSVLSSEHVQERLLYAQLVEATRCWTDGVVDDAGEADLGANLGWAFPVYMGGPFAYVDQIGAKTFCDRARQLCRRHGDRFAPPQELDRMAASGARFYPTRP